MCQHPVFLAREEVKSVGEIIALVLLGVILLQHILGSDSSNCLFWISLEAGVSSPACFTSYFTGWRYCAFPRAKCSRQKHHVSIWKPGTSWRRTSHIKHENSTVPSIREVADSGSFLIYLKTHPDGLLEKGILPGGRPVGVSHSPVHGTWVASLTGAGSKWCLIRGDLCSIVSVFICGTMNPLLPRVLTRGKSGPSLPKYHKMEPDLWFGPRIAQVFSPLTFCLRPCPWL